MVNRKHVLLTTLLSASVMLPMLAQSMTLSPEGSPDSYNDQVKSKNRILRLGHSPTPLAQKLETTAIVSHAALASAVSTKKIENTLAKMAAIHVDLAEYYGNDPVLNAYLEAAFKQHKLIILENTLQADYVETDALPFMAPGDIVLFQPNSNGGEDQIIVYGGKDFESVEQVLDEDGDSVEDYQTKSLEALSDSDRAYALDEVSLKIEDLITTDFESHEPVRKAAAGGGGGYSCPAAAREQRLCWAAIVTNAPYRHQSGNADINILHHYSVAQYRANEGTFIAVSPHGSANPNMKLNSTSGRGYYLQSVKLEITPTANDGMQLWSRTPTNQNNQTSISTTKGIDFGMKGNEPTFTVSSRESVTMSLNDWSSSTTSNGSNAVFNFEQSKYKSVSDWIYQNLFETAKFQNVPAISRYGLQYSAEAIWAGATTSKGNFNVNIKTTVTNRELYFIENDILHWKANWRGFVHTFSNDAYTFNNGWLKTL